ncbi:hypothetical protein PULV_a4231 [Pseudoalteromonas ulvae UL12]|uniref:non-ribosomal peptide synthetase n=1 Tax=Pseudoalteromonas ulvae TaxID=107327 RepID=UPI00186BA9CD|nr:non-ribosomal peptide synthetase [Pseudoalteromonas ulvae]MBE0361900.1 hypothetical protein [Pseudoalteromonas ulvae UL12]
MNISKFIDTLSKQEVRLFVENGKLKTKSAPGAIKPEQVEVIKSHKQQIIDFLSQESEVASIKLPELKKQSLHTAPLSFAQRRFWLSEQTHLSSHQYKVSTAFNIGGEFCTSLAERALSMIVDRHEILRTIYVIENGQPVQQIKEEFSFELAEEVLPNNTNRDNAVTQWLAKQGAHHFDLACDLPIRVSYLNCALSKKDSSDPVGVIFFDLHHIAVDGWSLAILVDEFQTLYQSLSTQEDITLNNLPIQYADYAAWQNDELMKDVFEQQLDYWQNQLKELPESHQLTTNTVREGVPSNASRIVKAIVNEEAVIALRALAKQHQVTMFMVLHTAFSIVLARFSNQSDVVMGTPVVTRPAEQLEGLVGCFLNTLVLRLDCDLTNTFEQLLKQSKKVSLAGQANQVVPFEMLVERLAPNHNEYSTPLFQVMFSMQSYEQQALNGSNVSFEEVAIDKSTTNFDLTLTAVDEGSTLSLAFEFKEALFSADLSDRIARGVESLLSEACENPALPASQLNIFKEEELAMLTKASTSPWPIEHQAEYAHELVQMQSQANPDKVAIRYEDEVITFSQLDMRSNQIAHLILETVAPDNSIVAILMKPGLDFVASMLGVLKAGCAYVPIDPSYPQTRIKHILNESGPALILADSDSTITVPSLNTSSLVVIENEVLAAHSTSLPTPIIAINDSTLAYVIYTSGSTGNPKGVMIEHGALRESTLARIASHYVTPERFLLVSSFAFDSSVPAIYWGLGCGGELHLLPTEKAKDAPQVAATIDEYALTHAIFLPGFYDAIIEHINGHSLTNVICAGESLSDTVKAKHFALQPQAVLMNEYGPTESTVWSSVKIFESDNDAVSIGFAAPHVSLHVLGAHGEQCPIGTVGELYIGGKGLARGYFNRDDLTAERFREIQLYNGSVERLYQTGDLVSVQANGEYAYVGRNDHQVKLRGYRIELSEIEASLLRYADIQQAVVLLERDSNSQPYLSAYLVGANALHIENIQAWVEQHLPQFMWPSRYQELPAFPLNNNGKVDRNSLSKMQSKDLLLDSYVAPQTEMESKICELLHQQFGLVKASCSARFTQLGLHSLQFVKLAGVSKETLGIELSVRDFYVHDSITQLALFIAEQVSTTEESSIEEREIVEL